MKSNGGKIRIILRRAQADASIINAPILLFLLVKETGWLWWYSLAAVAFMLSRVFDFKVIFGQEWDTILTNSKVFMGLVSDVREIKEMLQILTSDVKEIKEKIK